jgi:predicted HicB family RNase H-like nuclease
MAEIMPEERLSREEMTAGKFMIRVPPDVHCKLAIQAAEAGVNLNRLASSKLAQ